MTDRLPLSRRIVLTANDQPMDPLPLGPKQQRL